MPLADLFSIPPYESAALDVWFWLTLLIGLVWLKRHIDLQRGKREPVLTADPARADEELPPLSVLVAAKDEEDNIGRCLDGLLKQEYPDFCVIVINDRSDDRTGEIIDGYAARDSRVTAVHVETLPAGWFGKNHAMHLGMQRVTTERFATTDADCSFDSPHLLATAVRFARENEVDLLSVLPRLEAHTVWERIVQPVAGAIMVYWFPPQQVNSDRYKTAYANGAFMLTHKAAYARIGGHEAVRATLNEDMHFARRIKQADMRLRSIQGGELYRVRMYTGFPQIWRGWSRIFYGCFGTFPRLLVSVLMLSVFSASPYITLLVAPLLGTAGVWLVGAAAFAIASQQSILWGFYRITGNDPRWALTYPVGAIICIGMTLNAMRRLAGTTTTWRGTTYAGGASQTEPESPQTPAT